MIGKLLHIGIIVKDLDHMIKKFEGFGFICTEVIEKKEKDIKIAFFPIGDTMVEIICYMGTDKGDDPVIRSHKGAINHLCFEVDNLDLSIRDFERNGAKLLEGFPRAGAQGRVAFFDPETTENILMEICQV